MLRFDERDPNYMWFGSHRIRRQQPQLVIPQDRLGAYSGESTYSIKNDLINKHFICLLGLVVNPLDNNDFRTLSKYLMKLSNVIERKNPQFVFCITEYKDARNWKASRIENGIIQNGDINTIYMRDGKIA